MKIAIMLINQDNGRRSITTIDENWKMKSAYQEDKVEYAVDEAEMKNFMKAEEIDKALVFEDEILKEIYSCEFKREDIIWGKENEVTI